MIDSDQIPATPNRRNRDSDTHTSCKRIKFDDVIFRQVVKDESNPDLKVECVEDDVTSEICLKTESTESSNSKKKNNSPSNEATSRRQPSPPAAVTAPSSEEIDEFFKQAEKYQQKHFTEKYNFDFVKDVPVEGRYEWVQLK